MSNDRIADATTEDSGIDHTLSEKWNDDSKNDDSEMEELILPEIVQDQVNREVNCMTSSSSSLPSSNAAVTHRDVKYSILFIAQIGISIVISLMMNTTLENDSILISSFMLPVMLLSSSFSFIWIVLFFSRLKHRFIWFSFLLDLIGLFPLSIMLLIGEKKCLPLGILLLSSVCCDLTWMFMHKNGLDFAYVLLKMVKSILRKNFYVIHVAFLVIIFNALWSIWYGRLLARLSHKDLSTSFFSLCIYFHIYWTFQVLKNIITISTSGTVMLWFYIQDSPVSPTQRHPDVPPAVALLFLRNALTKSFGSVCKGSLFCPLGEFCWSSVRWLQKWQWPSSFQCQIAESLHIQSFIKKYHMFSFSHVAGYSKPFACAARDTWQLLQERGVEAIIEDDITSRILLFGAAGSGGLTAAITGSYMSEMTNPIYSVLLFFVIGFNAVSLAIQLPLAAIRTLFICFAENPLRLSQSYPIVYHRLVRISELRSFREKTRRNSNLM